MLSERENQVARMIAEGHTNKSVAKELKITIWSVNTYVRRIFKKLGVKSRAAMVAKNIEVKTE